MIRATAIAAALSFVAVLARHAAAQDAPLTSANWHPPARQVCRPVQSPRELPPVTALVDSAALLSVLAGSEDSTAGYAVLSAQFEVTGALRTLALVETDLPEATAARVATAAATFVEPQRPSEVPWSVRLRVGVGDGPALRVQRSEYCPAVTLPESRSQRAFVTAVGAMLDTPPTGEALVLRAIDETGAVARVDVLDVAGTPPALRHLAPIVLQADVFLPALLDRRAVIQADTLTFQVRGAVVGQREVTTSLIDINKLYQFSIRWLHPR